MDSRPRRTRSSTRRAKVANPPDAGNGHSSQTSMAVEDSTVSESESRKPKRGSVGVHIVMKLTQGELESVNTDIVQLILFPYASFYRFLIARKQDNTVEVSGNAGSVSEALRITRDLSGKPFDHKGIKGEFGVVTHLPGPIGLQTTEINPLQYDSVIDAAIDHEDLPLKYDPRWYGRELTFYWDYHEIMIDLPNKLPGRPKYPKVPEVADFWKDNCGQDFPALVRKITNLKATITKDEMHDFYRHLFHAIFDMGMDCASDGYLTEDELECRPGFAGWDIRVRQLRAGGTVMIVEYMPATFWTKSKRDEYFGSITASQLSQRGFSKDAWKHARARLKQFAVINESAAEYGPLHTFAALELIYAVTVYRDKVFYSRLHRQTSVFEILNSQGVFERSTVAPVEEALWQSVLSENGYQRFQAVVNQMDEDIAAG